MATLADELLNDFEDSGSEDGNRQNDFLDDEDREESNGHAFKDESSDFQIKMELDDDEEEPWNNPPSRQRAPWRMG